MIQYTYIVHVVFLFSFLLFLDSHGEDDPDFIRAAITIPQTSQSPEIDGELDDKIWENAAKISEFYQYTPQNGAAPTEKTIAYLVYDRNYLYVGLRCFDSEPDKIRATLTPRNQWQNNDNAFIYIDTYNNQRENFLFQINPYGVQKNSFDTIWHSAAIIDSLGWSGEMAIPFKSLRYPDQIEQSWGIVIGRNVYRKGEIINSVDCGYDEDFYSLFTQVKGIKNISEGRMLEFLPYGAVRYSRGKSFAEQDAAFGFDTKFGLATNLILDGSFAPDFSQVESDRFFVNFSPYEYQLSENRPFFNEGSSYFSLPYTLFYSRRIVNPLIMGKLTGKEGPWSIGALGAWDAPDSDDKKMVYALRLQKDVFKISKIGMMMSGFESRGNKYNRNISIDGQFSQGAEHHFQFQFASTFNSNSPHYKNLLLYLNHRIQKVEGINYSFTYLDIGPNYNPQTGIIGQTGYRTPQISLGYRWHLPALGLEYVNISTFGHYSEAYGGLRIGRSTGMSFSIGTINKLNASLSISAGETRSQILHDDQFIWNENIYPVQSISFNLSTATGSLFDGNLGFYKSERALYVDSFTDQRVGVDQSLVMGFTIKPSANLIIKNSDNYYHQKLHHETYILYETWLLNNSIHYQISRNIFSRIMQQFDTKYKSQQLDFLLGYEFFAGSTFYVSYKELRSYHSYSYGRENYMIFGKMSYLFRI
jgi:hypothetical protein